MTSWSIDAAGVLAVLNTVQTAAADLSTAIGGIDGAQSTLISGADVCTAVPAEIAALIESERGRLTSIGNRVSAGIYGAATATTCYVQADDQMVANVSAAQTAAISSATTGDFSYFTKGAAQ